MVKKNYINSNIPCPNFQIFRSNPTDVQNSDNAVKVMTPADKVIIKVDEEKKKKSNKKALGVGGAVLAIAGSAVLLNPKNASKILQKLKTQSQKNKIRLQNGKQSFMKTKFYQAMDTTYDFASRSVESLGNINNGKDILYQKLCSQKKDFDFIKNSTLKNFFVKVDDVFTKRMTKINNWITTTFDDLSKNTVRGSYKRANEKICKLDNKILSFKSILPADKQILIDEKLAEIAKNREFFSDTNVTQRLATQEKLMLDANLEEQVTRKMYSFVNGFKGNNLRGKLVHFDRNLKLWSEDILKPQKTSVEKEGQCAVLKLFGGGSGKKGCYDEIFDITRAHLDSSEQKIIEEAYKKASKNLTKANKFECFDYFDKKRDLILGSAPTDILTPVICLTAGGIAMAAADSKEERNSRWLTGNFAIVPTVIGVGTSIVLTAKLFSGAQGLLMGFGVGAIFSKLGSIVNKHIFGFDEDAIHEAKVEAKHQAQEERKARREEKQDNKIDKGENINA